MIDASTRQQLQENLLADLACARANLVDICVRVMKQVIAARSAIGIASVAGLGPSAVCFANEEGKGLTLVQLADLVKELAAKEDQIRNLIAEVDAQSAKFLRSIAGEKH
jgi:hypothetical protein